MNGVQIAISSKPGREFSEDIVSFNNGFFWLLDGATPPAGDRDERLTQVFLKELSSNIFRETTNNTDATPSEILRLSIVATRNRLKPTDEKTYFPYSTAVVVKVSGEEISYLVLGDSYLVINNGQESVSICDDRLKFIAQQERRAVRELRALGVDEQSAHYVAARRKLIESEMKSLNKDNGYWVASLDPAAVDYSIRGTMKVVAGETTVMAASDGFARLSTHFSQPDNINKLPLEVSSRGADFLMRKLRDLESDRRNFLQSASSSHDDASFFLVHV